MTSRELTSGFYFGHVVISAVRTAVVHLAIKLCADIFIQSGVIDIFPPEISVGGRHHPGFVGGAMGPPTKADPRCVTPVKISS